MNYYKHYATCGNSTSAFFKTNTGVIGDGLSANQFTLYLQTFTKIMRLTTNFTAK